MPSILNRQFQHPADGWYMIESLGCHPHRTAGVVQVIDAEAAQAIVRHFNAAAAAGALRHGHELLIDHEHFSDQPDQETRAYGWLQALQNREDGLYGRIRWTATGQAAVDGGDYRFFSTEYDAADLQPLPASQGQPPLKPVRPLRLAGLSLTNMNNNRGQKPITNRSLPAAAKNNFAGTGVPVDRTINPHKSKTMKSVCTLLGLPAEAEETSVHAAVARLLNRGDLPADALAALRAEHQSLAEQNRRLLAEQSETLLDGCGIRDERLRNRLKDALLPLASRQERLKCLADFGYQPGGSAPGAVSIRVLNRGTGAARESAIDAASETEQALALRIQNRAHELQGASPRRTFDACWNQAARELTKPMTE